MNKKMILNKWCTISIIVFLIGGAWILLRQMDNTYNKIEMDPEGAYIKLTSEMWIDDKYDEEYTEALITDTSYTYGKYMKKNPTELLDIGEWNIAKEDFTELLDYIINEKHFFDELEEGQLGDYRIYRLEILHKGTSKTIIPTEDFLEDLSPLINNIRSKNKPQG